MDIVSWEVSGRGSVQLGKCLVGEKSSRGTVHGEFSIGEQTCLGTIQLG